MSKFCGVISKGTERYEEFEFQFLFLEGLAEYLINETKYLQEDFGTKLAFTQEQHQQILTNEQNLIDLQEKLTKATASMTHVELGIQEGEAIMQQALKCADSLDQMICDCEYMNFTNNQRYLMELIEDIDSKCIYLDNLNREIAECDGELQQIEDPNTVMVAIMDCHNKYLAHMDRIRQQTSEKEAILEHMLKKTCPPTEI